MAKYLAMNLRETGSPGADLGDSDCLLGLLLFGEPLDGIPQPNWSLTVACAESPNQGVAANADKGTI